MSDDKDNGAMLFRPLSEPRDTGFWGLTGPTTYIALFLIGASMASFLAPMPYPAIVIGVSLLAFVPLAWSRGGRSGWELLSLTAQAFRGRRGGEDAYRAGTFSRIPGTSRLPGLLAGSTLVEDESIGGQRFAMIHLPRKDHYTVIFRVTPRGQEWIDQLAFDRRVSAWGDAVATIGSASDVVAISAVIETIPETGQRDHDEVERMIDPTRAHPLAAAIMREAVAEMPSSTVRTEGRVAVTFKAETALRRRNPEEQAGEIARRLPGIVGALEKAKLSARPMQALQVAALTRRAYSIESLRHLERAALDNTLDLNWGAAGPVSATSYRDHYLHDGGQSITWEMDGSPRSVVQANILADLLAANAELPWKRVAIVYRPHSSADAVKMVDRDYTNALAEESAGGARASAAASLKVKLTEAARDEQAQGAGVTRLGMLITVTTPVGEDMPAVESLVRDMAATSRLSIRRCYEYQDSAFAAGIGIGVILPEHATVSSALAG